MRILLLVSCLLSTASAHRLDEYLQAAVFSLEDGQLRTQIRLTPGVAVLPAVLAAIDANGDGDLSAAEKAAYGQRVLRDADLSIDEQSQTLAPAAVRFPSLDQLRQGLGAIEIDVAALAVPTSHSRHRLSFRNRHQRTISVYLVNFLAPADAEWRIEQQQRNYEQSEYAAQFSRRGFPLPMALWLGAAAVTLALWRTGGFGMGTK
jgi:hypothetical protein